MLQLVDRPCFRGGANSAKTFLYSPDLEILFALCGILVSSAKHTVHLWTKGKNRWRKGTNRWRRGNKQVVERKQTGGRIILTCHSRKSTGETNFVKAITVSLLNRMRFLLMVSITPVLFLLLYAKTSAVKKSFYFGGKWILDTENRTMSVSSATLVILSTIANEILRGNMPQ